MLTTSQAIAGEWLNHPAHRPFDALLVAAHQRQDVQDLQGSWRWWNG